MFNSPDIKEKYYSEITIKLSLINDKYFQAVFDNNRDLEKI